MRGDGDNAETLRILVAEDHEIGLELTCMMARRLGVVADAAADGFQALQQVRRAAQEGRPYSLVLMDFMMPVVDGIEATRRLRKAGFSADELPVIALTAVAEPHELGRFTTAGGQGYLAKPLSLEKLTAVLEAWLPDDSITRTQARNVHNLALRRRYDERKLATFARIDAALALNEDNPATLAEIRDLLHKLAGTAGLFGDESLSALAAACEIELCAAHPGEALLVLERHRERLGEAA